MSIIGINWVVPASFAFLSGCQPLEEGDIGGDGENNHQGCPDSGEVERLNCRDDDCDGFIDNIDLAFADSKFVGENDGDVTAWVAWGGDVNGDGFDDVLIGTWLYNYTSSAVYLNYGPVPSGINDLTFAHAKFVAEANEFAGPVCSAGDMNGDMFDDFLVGGSWYNGNPSSRGAVYLWEGSSTRYSGLYSLLNADARFIGEEEGSDDNAGSSVAGGGNAIGDDLSDFIIGAFSHDAGEIGTGAAYLVAGSSIPYASEVVLTGDSPDMAKLIGEDEFDYAGNSVALAGDVDGDGYDDILVGAPLAENEDGLSAGAAYLLYGPISPGSLDLSLADAKLVGNDYASGAGSVVAGAGDVNGDGYSDFLVAIPLAGKVALFYGASRFSPDFIEGTRSLSTADAIFEGEPLSDSDSFAITGGGDVNGDGLADIVIGVSDEGASDHAIYLFDGVASGEPGYLSGTMSLSTADARLFEETGRDWVTGFWGTVANNGDSNGDGFDDLLVGVVYEDGGELSSAVYLVLGGFCFP